MTSEQLQHVTPPLHIHVKMAAERCDTVNMDPDIEFLSDDELER